LAPAGDLAELLFGAVEPREDPGRMSGQGVAGLRQLDRTRAALDQREPDFSLQRGDVLAHRRLRQPQRLTVHPRVALAGRRPRARRPSGPRRIAQVVTDAGFTRFRRAAETPFNLVFEAPP
jgi:hypothetical protein